jgi:hypothetical protein
VIDPAIFEGDPPVREDGTCFVCLKPRRPERSRRYAGDIAVFDPFCSNTCAREWHENPISQHSIWGRPRRLEENAA